MALFLFETNIQEQDRQKDTIQAKIEVIQEKLKEIDGSFIEVQIAKELHHAFFIVETDAPEEAEKVFTNEDVEVELKKEVRLVGEELEDVKQQKDKVNYVVEWNLPENLTMDQYLARKQKNSVHYQEVPEVTFARTYVCEDMTKCLCFYDAPNQKVVEKAREAVSAPIDVITELDN